MRICFRYFYPGFSPDDHYVLKFLRKNDFRFELEKANPDFLFFSSFCPPFRNAFELNKRILPFSYARWNHKAPRRKRNVVRVFLNSEPPGSAILGRFEYSIGYAGFRRGNHYEVPNFINEIYEKPVNLDILRNMHQRAAERARKHVKFCNFLYSRPVAHRDRFFLMLSGYKRIDSPGKVHHNMPLPPNLPDRGATCWRSKRDFQSDYKFTIAFENCSAPGYVTEKIYHAFLSGSIPIYFGSEDVVKYFNPRAFINGHDFKSFTDLVEFVKTVDNSEELYLEILSQPIFTSEIIPGVLTPERLDNFLEGVFEA